MLKSKTARTGTAALILVGAVGFGPGLASASAAPTPSAVAAAQPAATSIPVTGTLPDGSAFAGSLSNLTSSVVNGVLTLSGTITGTGLPAGGTTFTAPIQDVTATGSCSILNLVPGAPAPGPARAGDAPRPGLPRRHRQSGAGNLLGNLLCAVAGLLDNTGGLGGALTDRRAAQPSWAPQRARRSDQSPAHPHVVVVPGFTRAGYHHPPQPNRSPPLDVHNRSTA